MLHAITVALVCHAMGTVPMVTAPLVDEGAIVLDGALDEDAWLLAQQPAPFLRLGAMDLAPVQPVVVVCRDAANLYVGARLPKLAGAPVKASVSQRDGPVWEDDALEVFIDPGRTKSRYYQFIVNAAGTQWESAGKDGGWNAAWRAATQAREAADFWSVEIEIPFAAVGGPPAEGEVWGFNVAWDRRTPLPLDCSWAAMETGYHAPERFCELGFFPTAAGIGGVRVVLEPQVGRIQWAATVRPRQTQAVLLKFDFGRNDALQQVQELEIGPGGEHQWQAEVRVRHEGGLPADVGEHKAVAHAAQGPTTIYRAVIPMKVPAPMEVTVRKFLLRADKILVQANASQAASRGKVEKLRAMLVGEDGRAKASGEVPFDQTARGEVWLNVADVGAGKYRLVVQALSPDGQVAADHSQDITIPPKPQWLGNREGITDKVLPPWTPLKVKGSSIMPWGRVYTWGCLPFPQKVSTGGADVLAGPMRLIAVVDGQPQTWTGKLPVFTKKTAARVEFTTEAAGAGAFVRASLWCEYDGCVRCDWRLIPKQHGAKLEQLVFEMPVRAAHAKYIYHFPGAWASAFNAHALTKDLTMGFRPFVWLGDEDRGVAWFCPSDEPFRPAKPDQVTEVVRRGDEVILRINMVGQPVVLEKPFECTFGFQATPVRRNEKTVWDYRIIHAGNYGLDKQEYTGSANIRWAAKGNIRLEEGTIEAWVRPAFDPNVPVQPDDSARGRFNRDFIWINYGGNQVIYYWNIDDRGMRFVLRTPDGRYPICFGARSAWKPGEWHHIAASWGEAIRLYVDGQLVGEQKWSGLLPGDLTGGTIDLGLGPCEFDVDDLCISDIAREPRGHKGPLAPDEHTLLLESFDQRGPGTVGAWATVPEKAVGGPGRVSGAVGLVDGKFGKAAAIGTSGEKVLALDYYRNLGVRTICFHEHWSNVQNYFDPADPKALKDLVRACHQRGISLLVYYGYEMSNIAPEWESYSDEALVYPRAGGYKRLPEQTAYICCYKSAWQDYLAWAIARTMDEFDMDGVYLDGTEVPWGCANLGHGCGYVGADGQLHPTYTFFETREMMKRIYAIVKSRKPDGQVNVHNSTCMTIPTLAWATSSWDGEQFGGIDRTEKTWPLDVLPLDTFRCEFMGRQWGVPSELLCYGRPYTYEEALAISLPHDVLVRPGNVELASKIWIAAERFGRKQAKWLPYWDNAKFVTTSSPDVLASIYSRGAQGALVVVSNLGRTDLQATVTLNLRALGLPPKVAIEDAIEGGTIATDSGAVSLPMRSLSFKILIVRPRQR